MAVHDLPADRPSRHLLALPSQLLSAQDRSLGANQHKQKRLLLEKGV